MKILLLATLAVASAVAMKHHDYANPKHFAGYLKELQASHQFRNFSDNEVVLYTELITAAEDGAIHLKAFLHRDGKLLEVFRMMDHLDKDDRSHLDKYIAYHVQTQPKPARLQTTTTDLSTWMHELHVMNKVLDHLHGDDLKIFQELMYAMQHSTLAEYMAKVSYGPVLKILSKMGKREHEIDQMLIMHLEMEAAMAASQTLP